MTGPRWPRSIVVAFARGLIHVVSLWIPAPRRGAVVAEWEGELWTLARRGPRVVRVLAFCAGMVPYAVWAARDVRREAAYRRLVHRDRWFSGVLNRLLQDAVYAVRTLRKRPGFTLTAVAIISLGVGATTTIYSVVDTVLLRSLPYDNPHELVFFDHGSHTVPDFVEWRDRTDAFQALAGVRLTSYDLTGGDRPERVRAILVTPDFFSTFGGQPLVGRLFTAEDYTTPVQTVVLSHRMWRQRWGGDPHIVGRQITINGDPLEVVGVLAPAFVPPEVMMGRTADVWLPFDLSDPAVQSRGMFIIEVAARLRPGATIEGAQAQLNTLAEALANEHPDRYRRPDGTARPILLSSLIDATVHEVADMLYLLLGAVGLMLLIACANVANLLLARGTGRAREIALRTAMGASRGRVLKQLLTESVVLSLVGGALGIGLAVLGVAGFASINPGSIPRAADLAVDIRILTFAFFVSVMTGIVFGILPAVQATRGNVNEILKEGAGSVTEGRGGRRLRDGLVIAEMSMALVLLAGAGVLFNSFIQLQRRDPGLEPEQLYTLRLALNSLAPEERGQFTEQALAGLASLPGTRAVGAGITLPFMFNGGSRCCWFMNFAHTPEEDGEGAILNPVTPGYFQALGATIVRGRSFVATDRAEEPMPMIVNASFGRRLFGEEDPVGKTLYMEGTVVTVVGVVNDVRHWGLTEDIDNDVYVPYAGMGEGLPRVSFALRSTTPAVALVAQVRDVIWSIEPDMPVVGLVPMQARVTASIAGPRFYSLLLAIFAILALMLAAAGMYSSMLYSVERRFRELGLRMALGARSGDVIRLVLQHGVVLAGVGAAIGLLGAFMLSRLLQRMLFGVGPTDVPTLAGTTALMVAVAMAACYLPARRAAMANPVETLRQ
ncbi:MAG: ABC transporter permease [Gemmatimonadetes bacterium]|nr:ABC transporter permease [Gemmatimonadota bacterium]